MASLATHAKSSSSADFTSKVQERQVHALQIQQGRIFSLDFAATKGLVFAVGVEQTKGQMLLLTVAFSQWSHLVLHVSCLR